MGEVMSYKSRYVHVTGLRECLKTCKCMKCRKMKQDQAYKNRKESDGNTDTKLQTL